MATNHLTVDLVAELVGDAQQHRVLELGGGARDGGARVDGGDDPRLPQRHAKSAGLHLQAHGGGERDEHLVRRLEPFRESAAGVLAQMRLHAQLWRGTGEGWAPANVRNGAVASATNVRVNRINTGGRQD